MRSPENPELSRLACVLAKAVRNRLPALFNESGTADGTAAWIVWLTGSLQEATDTGRAIDNIRLGDADYGDAPLLLLGHRPRRSLPVFAQEALQNNGANYCRAPRNLSDVYLTTVQLSRISSSELSSVRLVIWKRHWEERLRTVRHRKASVSAVLLAAARSIEPRRLEATEHRSLPVALIALRRDWPQLSVSFDAFCVDAQHMFDHFRTNVPRVPTVNKVSDVFGRLKTAAAALAASESSIPLQDRAQNVQSAFAALSQLFEAGES